MLNFKCGLQFFQVAEVVFLVAYYLVVLVAFACHQYHIAGLSQGHCGAYCLAAVAYAQGAGSLVGIESGAHVGQYSLGVFIAWIVGGQYQAVAASCGSFGHQGAFAVVAVASGSAHGNNVSFAVWA